MELEAPSGRELLEQGLAHQCVGEAVDPEAISRDWPIGLTQRENSLRGFFANVGGSILADTAGGKAELRSVLDPLFAEMVDELSPSHANVTTGTMPAAGTSDRDAGIWARPSSNSNGGRARDSRRRPEAPTGVDGAGIDRRVRVVVHPRLAGYGPTLFAGLSKHVDLKLVSWLEFGSGAVAMRFEPLERVDPES